MAFDLAVQRVAADTELLGDPAHVPALRLHDTEQRLALGALEQSGIARMSGTARRVRNARPWIRPAPPDLIGQIAQPNYPIRA